MPGNTPFNAYRYRLPGESPAIDVATNQLASDLDKVTGATVVHGASFAAPGQLTVGDTIDTVTVTLRVRSRVTARWTGKCGYANVDRLCAIQLGTTRGTIVVDSYAGDPTPTMANAGTFAEISSILDLSNVSAGSLTITARSRAAAALAYSGSQGLAYYRGTLVVDVYPTP